MRKMVIVNSTPILALHEIGRYLIQGRFYLSDDVYREVLSLAAE